MVLNENITYNFELSDEDLEVVDKAIDILQEITIKAHDVVGAWEPFCLTSEGSYFSSEDVNNAVKLLVELETGLELDF